MVAGTGSGEAEGRGYRLSAGVVVVRRGAAGWLFLMLRAYRNWDFPKGVVEPGEEPLIADLRFEWGPVYRETGPYGHRKIARYYLAATPTVAVSLPVSPELGRPEHDEWRWVDAAAALALASSRLQPIVRWAAEIVGAPWPP